MRAAIRVSTLWAGICAGVFTIIYFVAGGPIIAALTNIEAVRATALVYLPYVLASPLLSVW